MYGARPVDETSAPDLVHIVRALADSAGLPMPHVYIVDNPQPNAFATGRNPEHAAVCVTSGLLRHVNSEELAGVLAHELSHIKHRDTLTMTITATIAGAISMLANFALFAGMFGGGNNRNNPLRLCRHHPGLDPGADRRGAGADGDQPHARIRSRPRRRGNLRPAAVAGLGAQAHRSRRRRDRERAADANPATAHMFIINPLHGGFSSLFASHPSTERAHRAARGHGRADGTGRAPAEPMGVTAQAGLAARAAAQAILGEVLRKRRPLDAALDAVLDAPRSSRATPALRAPSPAKRCAVSASSTR